MQSRIDPSSAPQPPATEFGIAKDDLDKLTSVISVEGELDLSTAPRLKEMLFDSLEVGHSRLVIDLSRTTFMDSTALGVLIGVNRNLDVGARMAVVCTQPNVLKIFEFAGMDSAFAIFGTLDEALASVQQNAAQTG
jgi:anti-sigma B factor antagonist